MVRVLIAPQEFKGSLTAAEAAEALRRGIARARPAWELDVLPLSDGGPGFTEAMRSAIGGETARAPAHDALLRPIEAEFLWAPAIRTATIEAAAANGLVLIEPSERDAVAADSFGVGEIIQAALSRRPATLIVGVGGSATTDGGHGMARALGAVFRDGAGRNLAPGGGSLAGLARIDWAPPAALQDVDVIVATDVTNPLTGPLGAAAIYGPQKGASPADVDILDAALSRYAAVVQRSLGVDVAGPPGAGAAGGLAAGLVAFLGARIESGFEIVARVSNLEARLTASGIVLTGEGSFDSQSLQGKTTGRVLQLAANMGRPCVVFAGRADPASQALTLQSLEPDAARSMRNAGPLLEDLAARWASSWPDG